MPGRSFTVKGWTLIGGMALASFAVPIAAKAQAPDDVAPRTRSVLVYGDDACPPSTSDEIVVCARQPEGERYRIPKRFRGRKTASSPANNSWANKARTTDSASRTAAGVPNSCSAVGAAGQTGCFQQFQAQAAAERRAAQDDKEP